MSDRPHDGNPENLPDAIKKCQAGYNVFVIGHRGASSLAPENTVPSFLKAVEVGVDFIEFDVRRTRDEVLVVIHDGRVDRTTDSIGLVSEFTVEELKKLDAGCWFSPEFKGIRIPTLEEVLTVAKDKVSVAVEIKEIGIEEDVLRIIKEKDMVHDSMILTGGILHITRKIRELEPRIPIQADITLPGTASGKKDQLQAAVDRLLENSVNMASVNKSDLTVEDIVKLCHKRGLLVNAWPVDEIHEICACLKLGMDFITTNNPQLVINVLREEGYR